MKTRQKLSKDEQELLDNLQPAYDAWEQETIQRGVQQGLEQGIERGRQEGRQEGREEGSRRREAELLSRTVPMLLNAGLSIDQIAQQLQVDVEAVRRAAQQGQN
jgi:predicted transposase YdaD